MPAGVLLIGSCKPNENKYCEICENAIVKKDAIKVRRKDQSKTVRFASSRLWAN
jgi:hypothetical protein